MALETDGAEAPDEPRRLHHITRIDIEPSEEHPGRHPTHGWQVRVRRDGDRLSKFFADAKFESQEAAVEAAIEYRDRLLASIPEGPTKPRKAWSNTGVVGLSVREKAEGSKSKLYVQLNWVNAEGKRKAGSFSVDKWGIRRALWNGCLKLYRERQEAGYPFEEPHVMFARAQEPFADLIRIEVEAEQAAEREKAEAAAQAEKDRVEAERAATPEARMEKEEAAIRSLEDVLFG
ncbi:AP2 domain-containing protein [Rubrivirga sp.]|uniref:AP2 domain-containing protein n=1 Tax=Rubrivirga sp. TaxID=1885344 RepID=UPI003C711831